MTRKRWTAIAAAVAVLPLAGVVSIARAVDDPPTPSSKSPASCGRLDTPETGIQGDVPRADQDSGRAERGYNCGLALVGHNGFGGEKSSDLAWSGDCAYVQADGVVRVIDVHDPTAPVVTRELATGGGSENIHAVTTRDRALLVASRAHESGATPDDAIVPVDVFDVRKCTEPKLVGTIQFPGHLTDASGPVHNVALSPDGTKVYGTIPLQVADISNLGDPKSWKVRTLQCEILQQYHPLYAPPSPVCSGTGRYTTELSHEVGFDKAGTRMYIGGQQPQPYEELLHVVDITGPSPKIISTIPGAGHGMRRATIGGRQFLLHSDETAPGIPQPAERRANGCIPESQTPFAGTAQARLTDISDERSPKTLATLDLAINRPDPQTCAAAADSSVNSTIHYHEVDNPDATTFAMLSMKNAGLRVFDVRDPRHPSEVAYFNPGQFRVDGGSPTLDRARMHTFYDATTGHIWLLTESGGFWVLELEPQVRAALGLPAKHAAYPDGRAARPIGVATAVAVQPARPTADLYCQL